MSGVEISSNHYKTKALLKFGEEQDYYRRSALKNAQIKSSTSSSGRAAEPDGRG